MGMSVRFIAYFFLISSVGGCQHMPNYQLPSEPHSPTSQAFTQAVYELYDDNAMQVINSIDASAMKGVKALSGLAVNSLGQQTQDNSKLPIKQEVSDLTLSIGKLKSLNPNQSGYLTITEGNDAMAARTLLSRKANKSIDVQYYIWHNDEAGQWLLHELWLAAERGVKVRLLLDDFNITPDIDELLWHFDKHPNIAVRLINPVTYRNWRGLNYVTDFKRINRRMHNKSMTYDRQLSIIGGRNIGNEYLSDHNANQFADLDVLLVGNVVNDIALSFEWFWQSKLSYDISQLLNYPQNNHSNDNSQAFIEHLDLIKEYLSQQSDGQLPKQITKILAEANDTSLTGNKTGGELDSKFDVPPQQTDKSRHAKVSRADNDADNQPSNPSENSQNTEQNNTANDVSNNIANNSNTQQLVDLPPPITPSPIEALESSVSKFDLMERLDRQELVFHWADMQYMSDVPQKLDNTASTDTYIIHILQKMIKEPEQKLSIISSYFVPTAEGVDILTKLAERGVDVAILTNSYGATDVAAVHSGYAPWRKILLKAGVRLYELKPTKEERGNFFSPPSVTTTSLHAKSFATDNDKIFIGSFNFDPRSAMLNSELGVVMYDPNMVNDMHQALTDDVMQNTAYILSLDENNDIHWRTIDAATGEMVSYDIEPNMGIFDHLFVTVLSWLPIDGLL